jgi:flagellar biosynthesis/type III secretory pathway protein FliH
MIDRELQLTEEAPMAELLTRWERRGLQQGLQQGLERGLEQGLEQGQTQGMVALVMHQFSKKGIALDTATEARVRGLDREALLSLAEAVLELQNRADLDSWLASRGSQSE